MRNCLFEISLIGFFLGIVTIPFLLGVVAYKEYYPKQIEYILTEEFVYIEDTECKQELDYVKNTMSSTTEPLEIVRYIKEESEPCFKCNYKPLEESIKNWENKYWNLYREYEQCLISN